MRDDPLPSLAAEGPAGRQSRPESTLHARLSHLYFGDSPEARHFRYALLAFDIITITVFLVACFAREEWWITPLDL